MRYTSTVNPAMTSAAAPSGEVTSSGDLSSTYACWKAFNRVRPDAEGWVPPASTTGWLQYELPEAQTITAYAVTSRNEGATSRVPKSWTFKGSNDGTNWDTLDTQTDVTDWASTGNVRKLFEIGNTTAYLYYRLDITASNDAGYVGVGELEMMATRATDLVPAMTSAAAPSGEVSASTNYGTGYEGWRAFTDNEGSDNEWVTANYYDTGWLQYQFASATLVTGYAIMSRVPSAGEVRSPSAWTFKGSNDGSDWTTLDARSGVTDWLSLAGEWHTYSFANETAYAYYRLDITAHNGGSGFLSVGEMELYGEEEAPAVSADLFLDGVWG